MNPFLMQIWSHGNPTKPFMNHVTVHTLGVRTDISIVDGAKGRGGYMILFLLLFESEYILCLLMKFSGKCYHRRVNNLNIR